MSRPNTAQRSGNINIRVAPEKLGLIDRAARAVGKTRTDFILDTVTRAAEEAVLDQCYFGLAACDWQAFNEALDRPAAPNPRLAALLARRPPWPE